MSEAIEKHIPKKQKRIKKTKQPDWINEDILSTIKKRDQELQTARKTNSPNDWSNYKRMKCYVTNLIRKSECLYFQRSIEENKRNPKGIWKALKSLTSLRSQQK